MLVDPVKLFAFLKESNEIERIYVDPSRIQIEATQKFLSYEVPTLMALNELQETFAPGKGLRGRDGADVMIGSYSPPPGGPRLIVGLKTLLEDAFEGSNPWRIHVDFEKLHPYKDGNGRTGRVLWVKCMLDQGHDPFEIPFLQRFYYQTLEYSRG